MSQTAFTRALNFVLEAEGGYHNDPRDPGGETNFGISKRAYPDLDIANLTRAQARQIYQRDYWRAAHCHQLPPELAVVHFDCAVNQGARTAAHLLQRALNVRMDGIIGPVTLHTARSAHPATACVDYLTARAHRYASTHGHQHYLRGWLRRLFKLQVFISHETTTQS